MINKRGATQTATVITWVVIIGVVAYFANFGGFQNTVNGWLGTSDSGAVVDGSGQNLNMANCPTDGTTTLTLNTQDELTSSATNVDSEYFIFNGNQLEKEGSTGSDGTVDVDVACGKDYNILLVNTTAGTGNGLYGKVIPHSARISEETINTLLVKFGESIIVGIENPADPAGNANITLPAGATGAFTLKFKANKTERGYNKPIIMCEVNVSAISTVNIASFSDGTTPASVGSLPKRITATGGDQYYAFEYPKMLTPEMGVISASGTITALGSVTPSTADDMSCKIVDQAMFKHSTYKTSTSVAAGFPSGAENAETLADVGGLDSAVVTYSYVNAGGY